MLQIVLLRIERKTFPNVRERSQWFWTEGEGRLDTQNRNILWLRVEVCVQRSLGCTRRSEIMFLLRFSISRHQNKMSGVRQSGVGSILVYVGTVKFCTFLVVNNFYYQKYISTYKGWAPSCLTPNILFGYLQPERYWKSLNELNLWFQFTP